MTGKIGGFENGYENSGYFMTNDGGKTWKLKDFGGDTELYAVEIHEKGRIWVTGSSKNIFISKDFGEHWEVKTLPLPSSTRIYGIQMVNSKNGIGHTDNNKIIQTKDNWETINFIETPFSQGYNTKKAPYLANRINKIRHWKTYLVISQGKHVFYSKSDKIHWKEFPIGIIDFEIDDENQELFAVTDDLEVVLFSSPENYERLSTTRINKLPVDLKVVNHSLFLLDEAYEVYKINKNEFIRTFLYTTDNKIEQPSLIKANNNMTWGITHEQIYLSDDNGENWYRENSVNFSIEHIHLLNDSSAILWDKQKHTYIYSLKTHRLKTHTLENPLGNFLSSQIKSLEINSGYQGCFGGDEYSVTYTPKNKSKLKATNYFFDKTKKHRFTKEVNAHKLAEILRNINTSPSAIPSIQDFNITEKDKKNYLALKNENSKYYDELLDLSVPTSGFNFLDEIDSLDKTVLEHIFNNNNNNNMDNEYWSTSRSWFNITIINQNNDTLNISRHEFLDSYSWNLPWIVEFEDIYFNCYDINFSKFIKDCTPNKFTGKLFFDNKHLLNDIANYLYWNE